MHSISATFRAGIRAFLPIAVGIIPFALISGIAAMSVGLSIPQAIAMSMIVFAGSAQLVAMQLLAEHTPMLLIILTTVIINLRFVMYSASLADHLAQLKQRWKLLSAYLLTDQAYALAISLYQRKPHMHYKPWFYLGAAISMWITWQIGAVIGMLVGQQFPASWQLDFTIPLTFIALAMPAIKNRRLAAVALCAAIMAGATAILPYKLGLLLSVLAGVGLGLYLEGRQA